MIAAQVMRTVRLRGRLGDLYGREHRVAVNSAGEAIRWCIYQLKGDKKKGKPAFEDVFKEGKYIVVRGNRAIEGTEELALALGSIEEVSIVPEISGEKNGGAGKAIFGILLITAAVVFSGGAAAGALGPLGGGLGASIGATGITYGAVAMLGAGIALAGIQRMLTPTPHVASNQNRERPESRGNFLLNSLTNQTEQGGCVPYAAGLRVRVGTTVGSAGIRVAYTPLSELLDEQTEFDSYHNIFAPLTSFTTDTLQFVGMSHINVRNEDIEIDRGPYGIMDPIRIRGREIYLCGEERDTITGDRKLHVIVWGSQPFDVFQLIRITSLDEQTEYVAKATVNVDEFATGEIRYKLSRTLGADNEWHVKPVYATRWTWDLGADVSTVLPPTGTGELLRVKFSY